MGPRSECRWIGRICVLSLESVDRVWNVVYSECGMELVYSVAVFRDNEGYN